METWEEMSVRHSKERATMLDQQAYDRYQLSMDTTADVNAAFMLEAQFKQEDQAMWAQHYAELKAHPESPELAKWEDYYRPKKALSLQEQMALHMQMQKSDQEKLQDELREAVAKHTDTFDVLCEQNKKKRQEQSRRGLDIEQ